MAAEEKFEMTEEVSMAFLTQHIQSIASIDCINRLLRHTRHVLMIMDMHWIPFVIGKY